MEAFTWATAVQPLVWALFVGVIAGVVVAYVWIRRNSSAGTSPAMGADDISVRAVMRALPTAVMVVDHAGTAVAANQRATEFGIRESHGRAAPEITEACARAMSRGEPVTIEMERRSATAEDASLTVTAAPLDGTDMVLVSADIAQAHDSARVAHREFMVNVSHELKTPIGALALLAEAIVEAREDPERLHDFSSRIHRETQRLSSLLEQITDLSRAQASESVAHGEPCDLAAIVSDAHEAVTEVAHNRGVAIEIVPSHAVTVWGDQGLLTMAVRNILENAVRYSDAGARVTVEVSIDGENARVAVIDRGIGMEPGEVERVFERFYRADEARSRDSGGSGLGLAIVKHVVNEHAGAVSVWSQPGVGSTFTMSLPVLVEHADAEATPDG